MLEIPDDIHKNIQRLCALGDAHIEARDFSRAYESFMSALALVPEPKQDFEATTWIMAALGDMYFFSKDFTQLRNVLTDAMHCPGAIGNPFLHLRLGQAQFELENLERSADELCRAYMGAGRDIFDNDDPKYFEFLKTRISQPAGGEW
jgi:hypothetical protein